MKLLITQFSPPPATSSLFGPNILLNTLFSNTLNVDDYHLLGDDTVWLFSPAWLSILRVVAYTRAYNFAL
jgi:hypothetical protein